MAIYTIADLHLSLGTNKPMDIFGENWKEHDKKIEENWKMKVKPEDTVILAGDFSWAMYLEDTFQDFTYLSRLPGKKLLLKGNHDYWWTTLNKMRNYLKEQHFENIDFIYNNSYLVENKIITGTRGWNLLETKESEKIIHREAIRLELAIQDGLKQYGEDKEIIVFMHYPPITQTILQQLNFTKTEFESEQRNILQENMKDIIKEDNNQDKEQEHNNEDLKFSIKNIKFVNFIEIMKKYNVKRCYYGHLHGKSHQDAVEGNIEGIQLKLISADYLNFNLEQVNYAN